jgi:hypothetical protein
MFKKTLAGLGIGALATMGVVGGVAASATAAPANATAGSAAARATTEKVSIPLKPQPVGTVKVMVAKHEGTKHLAAKIKLTGLTPGSAHAVVLADYGRDHRVLKFGAITANALGQVNTVDYSLKGATKYVPSGVIDVKLGPWGVTGTNAKLAAEPIALAPLTLGQTRHAVHFRPVTVGVGNLKGQVTMTYDATAKTLKVTLTASGFKPDSSHAAHIHVGSCVAQGPVEYMIPDYVANGRGMVNHESRTLTGISSFTPPAQGWYFNLHLGTAKNILTKAGNPTLHFRPLLCGDIH